MSDEEKNLPENTPGQMPVPNKPERKVDWNKKYTTIAIYALLVILFTVFCAFFFLNYNDFGTYISGILSVFKPILYGIIYAYVLNYLMEFFENTLLSKMIEKGRCRLARALSVLMTLVVLLMLIALVILMIVPQVISGYNDFESKISFYVESVQEWLSGLAKGTGLFSTYVESIIDYVNNLINQISELLQDTLPAITSALKTIVITVKDVLLGIVFAIYFLIAKDRLLAQMKKLTRATFGEKIYPKMKHVIKICDDKFGKYVIIRLTDSILISIMCFFGFWAIGIPYHPLITFIVGFSSFIPIFGSIVGIALSSFIVFISSMDIWKLIGFLIFVITVMLVNKYVSKRFMHGNDIGLSAVWVFFAIVVMTGFFGLAGTIIGAPVFAIIYDLVKTWTDKRLEKRGVPTDPLSGDYLEQSEMIRAEVRASEEISREKSERTKTFFIKLKDGIVAFFKRLFEKLKAKFKKTKK